MALLKTFFESPHDFHSGYEAGRSTAGLPVVLPAGVQFGSTVRKGTVSLNGALLKSFFESPHNFYAGYEAGRSTAGHSVVLTAGVQCGSMVRKGSGSSKGGATQILYRIAT